MEVINMKHLSLHERINKAESLLDTFSEYTDYRHSAHNPYRQWLASNPVLTPEQVFSFLSYWYPVSRHQPQILLRCTSAFPEWSDRKLMMQNYLEEDGMVKDGHEPHYDLLQRLMKKLNPTFEADMRFRGNPEADAKVSSFHELFHSMTPAEATGYVAAIEHPALDISYYFNKIIDLCGRKDLLTSDLYLTIHVDVEPDHIIWSHGNALRYIEEGRKDEVIGAFQKAMTFWVSFWDKAFTKLNYQA